MHTFLVKAVHLRETAYPPLLKGISDAPKTIYLKGNKEALLLPSVAMVGTRKATGQGLELAERIAHELASQGLAIVSGLAQGIDASAHKGALRAHGVTIAVLGSSLEERFLFPRTHLRLAREIIEKGGALISEYERSEPALRHHFVLRNRIISGLSLGVLIVESPAKGGSLITAHFAKSQGRLVFAVPGSPWLHNAKGTNALIKQGAYLAENAEDMLTVLARKKLFITSGQTGLSLGRSIIPASEKEARIIKALTQGVNDIDKLAQLTKVEVASLLTLLMEMEVRGIIKEAGGRYMLL